MIPGLLLLFLPFFSILSFAYEVRVEDTGKLNCPCFSDNF